MVAHWDAVGLMLSSAISFITLLACLMLMRMSWRTMRKQLDNVTELEQWRAKDDNQQHRSGD